MDLLPRREGNINSAKQEIFHAIIDGIQQENISLFMHSVTSKATLLLDAEGSSAYLPDAETGCLRLRYASGETYRLIGTLLGKGEGLAGTVWATQEPLVVNDYQAWAQKMEGEVWEKIRAVMAVPIALEGMLLGIITVTQINEARHFTKDDLVLFQCYANYVALKLKKIIESNSIIDQIAPVVLSLNQCAANRRTFIIQHQSEYVQILHYIRPWLQETLGKRTFHLELAMNEAVSNALRFGTVKTPCPEIYLHFHKLRQGVVVRVKNNGPGFRGNEILRQTQADTDSYWEQIFAKESGRGIGVIKQTTDFACYNRAGNEILLRVKNRDREADNSA